MSEPSLKALDVALEVILTEHRSGLSEAALVIDRALFAAALRARAGQ